MTTVYLTIHEPAELCMEIARLASHYPTGKPAEFQQAMPRLAELRQKLLDITTVPNRNDPVTDYYSGPT